MGKSQPPRRSLAKGKKKAPTAARGKAPVRAAATSRAKAPARGKASAARKASATRKASAAREPSAADATAPTRAADEQLQVAMEELVEARAELSRLGHALSATHRELEERKLSSGSAEENLRAQMLALREELRVTLAELEISRNEIERLRGKLAQNDAASASRKPAGSLPSV